MKDKEIEELLGRVQRVDAPPYLLTRIEVRIAALSVAVVSRPWLAIAGALAVLVVVVNLLAVRGGMGGTTEGDSLQLVAEQMGLSTSNQPYQ